MFQPRWRWRVLALLSTFLLVAAACGDDDTTPATPAPTAATPAPTPAPTTPPVEVPKLDGMRVIDDLTFEVTLNNADPEFPIQLNYAAYFPLPDVFFDDPIAYEENPIGNGPFMVDENGWQHDLAVRTVPYPDYIGSDAAQITGSLTFQIYADLATAFLDLRAGNLDIVDQLPLDQLGTAPDEFGARYGETAAGSIYFYGFPEYVPDLTTDMRRALSMATDRVLLNNTILNGSRQPAYSTIPSSIAGSRTDVCDNWNFDPVQAKQVYDDAGGWPSDELTVWFNSEGNHDQIAEAITNMWVQNLGIDPAIIRFESLQFPEYLPLIDGMGMTGPYRLGWGQDYPSPLNFMEPLYDSRNFAPTGSNSSFYDNPEFDDLLDQGKAAIAENGSLADGIPFYQLAEDLLCRDLPIMPIYFDKNVFAWSENVDNVTVDAFGDVNVTTLIGADVSSYISEPEHLNPLTSNESEGIAVLRALFAPLVQFDAFTGESFNLVAESIESTDRGKTWVITLNPGFTFHNGQPVTAQTFVNAWSYGATAANGQQNNSSYRNIVGYEVLTPSTDE